MSVCLAASLALQGGALVYAGPGGAAWCVDAASIRAVGELTTAGRGEDHLLAFVVDAGGGWFQASRGALGADEALAALGLRLGGAIVPGLDAAIPGASRVLWPPGFAGKRLFEFGTGRPRLCAQLLERLATGIGAAPPREGQH